jgi:leader peptidase (prepilin peptidase) / N-methyltransferase
VADDGWRVTDLLLIDFPPLFLRVFAVLFGLIWGSFLNVVIHRLPRGMSLSRPPSHCPACRTPIKPWRNIPVVSWLAMRGRAPCCGARVSPRYVAVELLGGVLSLAVLEARVMTLDAATPAHFALVVYLAYFALALGLLAGAFIDLEFMILPDRITIGGTVLGIGTFALREMSLLDAVIGAAAGFAVVWLPLVFGYEKLRGRAGMGLGDAKLVMLAGAWLGWPGTLVVLGAGAVQGTIAAIALAVAGRRIEEPEAVKRERAELQAELEKLSPEEREQVLEELGGDPLAEEPEEGWFKSRLAFGPFLILATLEATLIGMDRILGWVGA